MSTGRVHQHQLADRQWHVPDTLWAGELRNPTLAFAIVAQDTPGHCFVKFTT
jgi:hypothetical protein